jgi:hypothetical protein
MAEGKKTFIFYSDWINMVREMPDIDAGVLLKHILSYVNDENPTTDNLLVKMAFGHMKPLLKSDLDKWEGIRLKRKEAGAKGGVASAKQKQANAKQVQPVNDNVNVSIQKSIDIPTPLEFKKYALENGKNIDVHALGLKYKSWEVNGWKDGNNKPIKNWKTKLLNTLKYLETEKQTRL